MTIWNKTRVINSIVLDMKKTLSFLPFLTLILLLALAGCEKNDVFGDVPLNTDRVIAEFSDPSPERTIALDFSNTELEFTVADLRLFIRSKPAGNVTVKFAASPTVVADYNTENGTSYTALPQNLFQFTNTELVLNETDREKAVKIKLKPSDLVNDSYALGLTITEVTEGEISERSYQQFIILSVKNKYDGLYEVTGSCVDLLGVYTGIYPNFDVGLRTADAVSVDYLDPVFSVGPPFNENAYIIENAGTGAPAWLFSPRFVFDPATDKVVAILDNDGGVPTGVIDPAGPNQFTENGPDDKVFTIRYTVFDRFVITETWTYTGPR